MSTETEIEELQKQRDAELKSLKFTASRTKRNITRAVNPDRQIRKHLGLVMGAAVIGGYLLAPNTPKAGKQKKAAKPGGFGATLTETINHYFPQVQEYLPFLKKKPIEAYETDDVHHDPTAPVSSAHQATAEDYGREHEDVRPFSAGGPAPSAHADFTSDPAEYQGYTEADAAMPHARGNGHRSHARPGGPAGGVSDTLKGVLAATIADVAGKVNWQQLFDQLVHQFTSGLRHDANPPEQPSVAVADAGTTAGDGPFGGRFSNDPPPRDKPKGD